MARRAGKRDRAAVEDSRGTAVCKEVVGGHQSAIRDTKCVAYLQQRSTLQCPQRYRRCQRNQNYIFKEGCEDLKALGEQQPKCCKGGPRECMGRTPATSRWPRWCIHRLAVPTDTAQWSQTAAGPATARSAAQCGPSSSDQMRHPRRLSHGTRRHCCCHFHHRRLHLPCQSSRRPCQHLAPPALGASGGGGSALSTRPGFLLALDHRF